MEKLTVKDLVEMTDRSTMKRTGVETIRVFKAVITSIENRFDDDGRQFFYITYEPTEGMTNGLFGACRVYADGKGQKYGRTSMKVLSHNALTLGEKWYRYHWQPKPGDTGYDLMC